MKTPNWLFPGAVLVGWLMVAVSNPAQTAPDAPTPAPLRPPALKDAEGRTLRRAPTGHITNYDEEKVPPYTLPDVLILRNGQPVRAATSWFKQRRPELLELYTTEIYGRVPAGAPRVTFEVAGTEAGVLDGKAVRKHIRAHFGDRPGDPVVNFMLYLPARAAAPAASRSVAPAASRNVTPVPVVLNLTFGGDPALAPATPPGGFNDAGPIAEIVERGYGYAILRYTEIQADAPQGYRTGVIGHALAPGQAKPAPDEWGTISAWAWGLSRIMDYLETDPAVDAKRVALVGHSRLGKTVLWAGAQDERFALIFSSQAGEMGSALARRDFGETVDDMVANFGYQFAGNFQRYSGHWSDMPVDAHMLLGLIAPRPLLVSGGSGDQWSDPHGEFLALVAAGPVWRLLGRTDLGTTEMPPLDQPVVSGTIAFLEHNGPHAITPLDWKTFLDFADRFLQPGRE